MHAFVLQLEQTVDEYLSMLQALTEEECDKKPFPNKWSKKELIGHLIDSAQKNIPGHCGAIRRAIRTLSWLIYGVCEQTDQYYSFKSVTIFKR